MADLELLPICAGATVRGTVVDASTQLPIAGAMVFATGANQALTDAAGHYRIDNVPVGVNNSPLSVQISVSAAGYFSQSKQATVFCGAAISIDFGRHAATGAIEGYVTRAGSGDPIAGVFVGSEFGAATSTDASGYYRFDDVPVNPDGSDRTWQVTADPVDFDAQTKPITVRANETARLDFQFGATAATGLIVATVQTLPDGSSQSFVVAPSYGSPFSLTDGQSKDSGPLASGPTYQLTRRSAPGGTSPRQAAITVRRPVRSSSRPT